ncbi:BamA/TamA family outer membrane protein [Lutibacter flavus]|uniref:Hemolysin activation/secretion protein n=1 Tax=Lutibacter flavus TaxID=691689 RepID=A0A238Y0Q9_9FLAO|nr:hypothetical protein [Lutibacter flavus]SNR64398.1 Hemolysin activation/secretion protein [Lutibacter flavus]
MYNHTIIFNALQRIYHSILLLLFFITPLISVDAQSFELKIYSKKSTLEKDLDSILFKNTYLNKYDIYKVVDSISYDFALKGFINNSYLLKEKDTVINCFFTLNTKIDSVRIFYDQNLIALNFIKTISNNYTENYFEVHTSDLQKTLNAVSQYFETKGFSFSKVSLNNLILKNNKIEADLDLEVSTKRRINAIFIKGYDDFPKKYLKHYLDIDANKIFNYRSLLKTQELINTIPFITQIKNPEVLFTKDSTTLFLYLKKKSISSFDGIIGFSNEQKSKKIKLNGHLNLLLNNIFNNGESIGLNWRNTGNEINILKLSLNTPYILRSKFSAFGSFNIFKQDSTYTNTNNELKLNYSFNRNQSISSVFNFENSNTSTPQNTLNFKNYNKIFTGISYSYLPAIIQNKNHFNLVLSYLIGSRTTKQLKSKQNKAQFYLEYLIRLNQKNNILIKNSSEFLNASEILENELITIGGVNSIRGFDEFSIPTSKYSITNIEYQFYTNNTNYVYTIADFAFVKNDFLGIKNNLLGIGLGYSFKSNKSIINFGYAIGKTNNQAFKINNAKIHIKFSSYF